MGKHLFLGLVGLLLLVACVDIRRSATPTPAVKPASTWLSYGNPTFGLSFRYPPSMTLLLDEPDTSGIQLANGNLKLGIILNPRSADTVEGYVSRLRSSGFKGKRQVEVQKGPWKGVRLEGIAKDPDGSGFAEVVYLVKSRDSVLSLFALWNESPPDYQLVEILWSSLQLRFDSFPLSPTLLSDSFTTFSSPVYGFSFGYPSQWQAGSQSESLVFITDPWDSDAFLVSIIRRNRQDIGLGDAVEEELRSIKAFLQNSRTESQNSVSVDGATAAMRLAGSGRYKDGVPGRFESLVAISSSDVYVVTAVFTTSKAESLIKKFDQIFRTFTVTSR